MKKTIITTSAAFLILTTLSACGSSKSDEVALCKQECEKAMDANQKQFCLSACETAKEYSEKMKDVPVDDIVNDFNEDIYGNMNDKQKAQMKAMQDAGQIPTDLSEIPVPPVNPEDWEPNDDGFGEEGGTEECAGAFCE